MSAQPRRRRFVARRKSDHAGTNDFVDTQRAFPGPQLNRNRLDFSPENRKSQPTNSVKVEEYLWWINSSAKLNIIVGGIVLQKTAMKFICKWRKLPSLFRSPRDAKKISKENELIALKLEIFPFKTKPGGLSHDFFSRSYRDSKMGNFWVEK